MTQRDTVIFDLGGVLLDWNPRHLYRQLFADEPAMEHFLATVGHARQAGGDSTLKLRCHGYGGLGAKSSAAVHCKGARSTAGRIVLRPEYRYQALRLKAHRCAAAGLDSGTAAERLASMPSTP